MHPLKIDKSQTLKPPSIKGSKIIETPDLKPQADTTAIIFNLKNKTKKKRERREKSQWIIKFW